MKGDISFVTRDVEIEMITAAEYRAWAEESLECARNAATESSREQCIKFAEIWLESALRAELPQSGRRPQHQKQTSKCVRPMSALHPKADIAARDRHFG
jgi:hypothetical protein